MGTKSSIVSKVLFSLSVVLFLIFAGTVFFAGQTVGGAIYFIYLATEVAFTFLDRKYNSTYIDLYRYSVYVADAFNILAVGTLIFYGQDVPFMIATIAISVVAFLVDLFMKNSKETRRLERRIARLLNCVLMLVLFPYFFYTKTFHVAMPITAVVVASVVLVLKVVLAVVPFKGKDNVEKNEESQPKEKEIDEQVAHDHDKEHAVE